MRRGRTTAFCVLLIAALCTPFFAFAGGSSEAAPAAADPLDVWMQSAQVGPYQPATEDWNAIAEAALSEPPLVMYSNTSRGFPVVEQFNELYGLSVEMLNLSTSELNERLRREYDAGIHAAGVAMTGNIAVMYDQLMVERNALTRYVPREMEAQIPERDMNPVLVHRYSAGTWYYTSDRGAEMPYENIWELTTERFRNRVAMQSPLRSGTTMDYMVGIVANADLMEELYEEFFGESIQLTTPNAGYEWIKRLLDNELRVQASFRDVADAVTNADPPFLGFGTQSVYRDVISGQYDFELDTDVNPAILSARPIAMVSYTESPNTAKLLIRYLTSQEGGDPWWGADFPVNPQVTATGPMAALTLDSFERLWAIPIDDALTIGDDVADFWIVHE